MSKYESVRYPWLEWHDAETDEAPFGCFCLVYVRWRLFMNDYYATTVGMYGHQRRNDGKWSYMSTDDCTWRTINDDKAQIIAWAYMPSIPFVK